MDPSRRNLLGGGAAAAALGAAGAGRAAASARVEADYLDAVFTDLAERYLIRQPEQATRFGLDHGPREGLKAVLADASVSQAETDLAYCERGLGALAEVDALALPPAARFDVATVAAALELGRGGARFRFGDNTLCAAMNAAASPYAVSPRTGVYQSVPEFLDGRHQVRGEDDADAYYSRVHEMSRALAQETDRIARDAARGVTLPRALLDQVIQSQSTILRTPAAQSRLVRTLAVQGARHGLAGHQVEGVQRLVERQVYPALARQMETLKALRDTAGDAAGVLRLPDGEAYYDWLLKVGTSTPLSAKDLHRIGLEQTAAIGAQMDALRGSAGMSRGSAGARMRAIGKPGSRSGPTTEGEAVHTRSDRPLIRALLGGFNGYVRGYRLYGRQLAIETAGTEAGRVERLEYLRARQLGAIGLVIDTGLHAQGWSRARAVSWAVGRTGISRDVMTREVDRCCVLPGVACGEAIGHMHINRLRAKAREALGPRFDVRRFNQALDETGPAPLPLLAGAVERRVGAWRET